MIDLESFGKIYKPKVLVEAFLLCNKEVDAGDWWRKVLALNANSKSYKRDTIQSTYGLSLENLFGQLDVSLYVAVINSFVVFHQGRYQFVDSSEEAKRIIRSKKRFSIRAVGIKIHLDYNPETNSLGEEWEPTTIPSIQWFFHPKHLVDIETIQLYENINVGDMLVFKTTQALVTEIKMLKRKKFWATCSWTKKKITVLNGSTGGQVRLITNRPFTIKKSKIV